MLIKNRLLAGTISAFLLVGGLAGAEEIKPKPVIERTLEQKASITFNYNRESEQKSIDYSVPEMKLWESSAYPLWRESDIPELSQIEKQEVKNIMKDIKEQNINSYQELVEASKNFSENQKLDLASTLSAFLYFWNSIISNNEIPKQEEFFQVIQNSSISGNENPLHDCLGISAFGERYLNDIGIKSSTVSGFGRGGGGHAYVISKVEDGTAVIDGGHILIANTRNTEKTLRAYQKNNGTTALAHDFFENTKLKYRFITPEGERFLRFTGHDESSEPLENTLIQDFEPEHYLTVNLNLEDFLTSIELNLFGFFVKGGEIRGDSSSPLHNMSLIQAGFKRKFLTPNINNKFLDFMFGNKIIDINGNFISGNLFQDTELDNNKIQGIMSNLVFATNNERGFNFAFRQNYTHPKINVREVGYSLFYNLGAGVGASYKISTKKIDIEPYLITQYFWNMDLKDSIIPKPAELVAGAVFELKTPHVKFSIEPYYLRRPWEQGLGGKVGVESENFGLNVEGFATKSDYEFCPDKWKVKIGSYVILKNFTIKADYKREGTNYDGEIENQSSFHAQAGFKF